MLVKVTTIGAGATAFGLLALAVWPQSGSLAMVSSMVGGLLAWAATYFDEAPK